MFCLVDSSVKLSTLGCTWIVIHQEHAYSWASMAHPACGTVEIVQ